MGILKGIGSLLKAAPKINRRLTPEEIAKKDLMEAKQATQAAKGRYEKASTQLDEVLKPYRGEMMSQSRLHGDKWMKDSWTPQMPRYAPSTAMRAKQVGDETMEMIRDSVMKMDLPEAKKAEAIKSAATAIRNATPAELARMDPSVLVKNFMSKYGPYIGIGVGYGVADNKEAIGDMLKAVKLPTGIDIEMTPAGDIFGGGEDVEEPSFGTKTGEFLMDWLQPLPREWGQVDPKIKID